jgi:hypothetical protein
MALLNMTHTPLSSQTVGQTQEHISMVQLHQPNALRRFTEQLQAPILARVYKFLRGGTRGVLAFATIHEQ